MAMHIYMGCTYGTPKTRRYAATKGLSLRDKGFRKKERGVMPWNSYKGAVSGIKRSRQRKAYVMPLFFLCILFSSDMPQALLHFRKRMPHSGYKKRFLETMIPGKG